MAEIRRASEPTPPESITRDELVNLLKLAEKGDKSCLPRLRDVMEAEADGKRSGRLLEVYGNPPTWLRNVLVKNWGGKNIAIAEAADVRLHQVRRELEGDNPSPLERLLGERAAYCWFLVYAYEMAYAGAENLTIRQAELHLRKIDSAHKRFLSAVATLARVRKLALPALQVNIGANQVNMAQTGY